MDELDSYQWSGHGSIIGNIKHEWMDVEYVLAQFGVTRKRAKREYRKFVEKGINMGRSDELTGGGLIRSQGGWSNVVSMRRREREGEFDERILGGSDFVQKVLEDVEERDIRQLKIRKTAMGISDIIGEECEKFQVSATALRNGSRRSRVYASYYLLNYT
jgi:putative transposase